jgi:hypothetical protein
MQPVGGASPTTGGERDERTRSACRPTTGRATAGPFKLLVPSALPSALASSLFPSHQPTPFSPRLQFVPFPSALPSALASSLLPSHQPSHQPASPHGGGAHEPGWTDFREGGHRADVVCRVAGKEQQGVGKQSQGFGSTVVSTTGHVCTKRVVGGMLRGTHAVELREPQQDGRRQPLDGAGRSEDAVRQRLACGPGRGAKKARSDGGAPAPRVIPPAAASARRRALAGPRRRGAGRPYFWARRSVSA